MECILSITPDRSECAGPVGNVNGNRRCEFHAAAYLAANVDADYSTDELLAGVLDDEDGQECVGGQGHCDGPVRLRELFAVRFDAVDDPYVTERLDRLGYAMEAPRCVRHGDLYAEWWENKAAECKRARQRRERAKQRGEEDPDEF